LSGGQQQRVAIAVALANNPALLLADELTGALDHTSAEQVMQLIADLRRAYNLTIILVTHDMDIARYADRTLTLRDGALGQDLTHAAAEAAPVMDEGGRIRLPDAVRAHLDAAARIAVEIRPEGVLLRPEQEEVQDTAALLNDMLPQDEPVKHDRGGGRFSLRRRKPEEVRS
ncbi:MAG: ATP-binding cassette domain-containing protein, partial [Anaerolineae bacterium]|nr:ATP-binding cassette domain-containing protein [Anaerolineae bacterium]